MPPVTTAPTAPLTGRVSLSIEAIVDTACELIAESHTDQLTMRKLSERLGVALGATYHHVPNRDALLVLVADRINRQVVVGPTNPRAWQATLRTMMIDYAAAYSAYPGMATFCLTNLRATGPVDTRDQVLEMLAAAGFARDSAIDVLAALFFYANGATATDIFRREQPGFSPALMWRRFEQGLELLLQGAAVQLRADKRARRTN